MLRVGYLSPVAPARFMLLKAAASRIVPARIAKTVAALIRRADKGALSRMLVEATILLTASRSNPNTVLRDAATAYKVDTEAIALKVKQEFAAREKAKKPHSTTKTPKRAA